MGRKRQAPAHATNSNSNAVYVMLPCFGVALTILCISFAFIGPHGSPLTVSITNALYGLSLSNRGAQAYVEVYPLQT